MIGCSKAARMRRERLPSAPRGQLRERARPPGSLTVRTLSTSAPSSEMLDSLAGAHRATRERGCWSACHLETSLLHILDAGADGCRGFRALRRGQTGSPGSVSDGAPKSVPRGREVDGELGAPSRLQPVKALDRASWVIRYLSDAAAFCRDDEDLLRPVTVPLL